MIMKVGVYAAELYPGGEINYTKSLVAALSSVSNLQLDLIVTEDSYKNFENFPENIHIKIIKNNKIRSPSKLIEKIKSRILKVLFFILGKSVLTWFLNLDFLDLDLLIFPYFAPEAAIVDVPYIITPHDRRAFQSKYAILRALYKRIIKNAESIVVESLEVKQDLLKFSKINDQKIITIVCPPPLEKNAKNTNNLESLVTMYSIPSSFLIYPAHIIPSKNQHNLLYALAKIKSHYGLNMGLVCTFMCKDQEYYLKIKKIMQEQKLDVVLLERIPYEDVISLYSKAKALVMPTLLESVSMPIWEAFNLGCPVVCSSASNLPDQVGDAALIFDPYDIDNMAAQIYQVIANDDLREELAQRGRLRVEELTLEKYSKKWERTIFQTLNYYQ
jgi:glycosyltransferase involved in cell wall biosynthesis